MERLRVRIVNYSLSILFPVLIYSIVLLLYLLLLCYYILLQLLLYIIHFVLLSFYTIILLLYFLQFLEIVSHKNKQIKIKRQTKHLPLSTIKRLPNDV